MTATTSQLWTESQRLHVGPPSRRDHIRSALVWSDLLCLVVAFTVAIVAEGVRTEAVRLEEFLSMRMGVANFVLFVGLVLSWHLCFRSVGLYDASRPLLGRGRSAEAARGVAFATLLAALCSVLFHVSAATPTFLVGFWILGSLLVTGVREAVAVGLAAAGKGARLERHVLVAGTSQRALSLAREIETDPDTRARVVGFVDDEWAGTEAFRGSGGRLVADLKNLGAYLRDHVVDEIVIALPLSLLLRYRARILSACGEQGVTVRFPVSLVTDLPPHSRRRRDDVLLTVSHVAIGGWQLAAKRALDLGFAGLGLVALAPVLALIALAIRLDSPGPAFFAQERVGLNKRRFRMHKFRTMVVDAESRIREIEHLNHMQGPTFKLRDDPRVTRVGRFLRRSSIDELPQLWNVLKGEMSLVGPRPLPLRDVEGFEEDRHRRRFSVRPGLTGLWQVSGRNELSFETWMELDLQYMDTWSLGLDVRILMRTVPAVLSGRGSGVNVASEQSSEGVRSAGGEDWPVRHLLFGVPVSAASRAEAELCILAAARAGRPALVDHLSAHGLAEANRDPRFREALARFDLVAPDGQPVRWALNLLFRTGLRERVYGPALMDRLCARAAEEGIGVYLYGGSRDVLRRLCENLRERHRGLRIVGAEAPPFRALTAEEDQATVESIERSGARLVFVGLGCPKQELFAAAHADRIRAVQLCVGAAFDFLAGSKPTAPRWMQERGLEWLFRLANEPRRLWRRYLVANSHFLVRLGRELARQKLGARSHAGVVAEAGDRAGDAG